MTPAIHCGAGLLAGMLIGFMFQLAGTIIITIVLGYVLFRAAKDLEVTKPRDSVLQPRSSQRQTMKNRRRRKPGFSLRTPEKYDWPLSVHGYDSPELFKEDALIHIRQNDREIAEHERNIQALVAEIKKLQQNE